MKCNDITQIRYSPRINPHKKNTTPNIYVGFDTEWQRNKGSAFLACFYNPVISISQPIRCIEHFHAALQHPYYMKQRTIFVCWNLDADTDAILKHLSIEHLEQLKEGNRVETDKHIYTHIKNKLFSIQDKTKRKYRWDFIDIAQFYYKMRLNDAATQYLGSQKDDLESDFVEERFFCDNEYAAPIIKYCMKDSQLTYELCRRKMENVHKWCIPKKPYSYASIVQQYFLEGLKKKLCMPKVEPLSYSLKGFFGGRFEVYRKGFFVKAHQIDLNSCFPSKAYNLPDFGDGKWYHTKSLSDAQYGIYKCSVSMGECFISPLKHRTQNDLVVYPSGCLKETYLTREEILLSQKMGADVNIIDGYYFEGFSSYKPYMFLKHLFGERKKSSNQDEKNEIKNLLNSFYGKTIQLSGKVLCDSTIEEYDDFVVNTDGIRYYKTLWKAGKLFNPVAANFITSGARCELLRAAIREPEKIIACHSDSILSSKRLGVECGSGFGEWKYEGEFDNLVVLGSGVYGNEDFSKIRGFVKRKSIHALAEQKMLVKRRITLKSGLRSVRPTDALRSIAAEHNIIPDGFACANVIGMIPRTIDYNFDHKRVWERDFVNWGDIVSGDIISSKSITI